MTGEFHESCVARITNDLVNLLRPQWITVEGQFTPRGGIPFWPTCDWHDTELSHSYIGSRLEDELFKG